MKPTYKMILALAFSGLVACESNPAMDLGQSNLIPIPNKIEATGSSFKLDQRVVIKIESGAEMENLAEQLSSMM